MTSLVQFDPTTGAPVDGPLVVDPDPTLAAASDSRVSTQKAVRDIVGGARLIGSATYNPPSLAAGVSDTIQTMTLNGVGLGDYVVGISFTQDLAGAQIIAWVSAPNTVSYYVVNTNGANPLDLASGTLKIRVRKGTL